MFIKAENAKTILFIFLALTTLIFLAACAPPATPAPTSTLVPTDTATAVPPTETATETAVPPAETPTNTPTMTLLPVDAPAFETPAGISNLYIEYIFDASGSMLEALEDGSLKRDAARDFLIETLLGYKAETHLGLRAYGHRVNWEEDEAASCEDIELIAPVELGQMNDMALWLMDFETLGMTPLHASVEQALEDFDTSDPDRENNLVLISDGIESCGGDPCELVEIAQREGVNFKIHVVGVAVDAETQAQLECIAKEGGGVYYDVDNADEFEQALEAIQEEHEEEEEIISYADATQTAQPSDTPTPTKTATPIPPTQKPPPTRTSAPPPTQAPPTAAPTQVPPTAAPTQVPPTTAPTQVPPTAVPTQPPAVSPTPTIHPTVTASAGCTPPTIVQFTAVPPPAGSTARFTLYYEVQNAARVEIFGNVLSPPSGTFDVWDNDTNYWVLWTSTGDSNCYAEEAIQVDPDSITPSGSGLTDVEVDRQDVTISVRDHASQDGDRVDLFVNGTKVLGDYTLTSSPHGVGVHLNSGENKVEVVALNEGSSSPNTVEVSVSNVVSGSSVQVSTGLKTGQSESFKIFAP